MADKFITYTHPSQQSDKINRRKVAAYIGTHYRNRSKPAARKAGRSSSASESLTIKQPAHEAKGEHEGKARSQVASETLISRATIPRDTHGLRHDPFQTYPIKFTQWIPGAIDYFLNFYAPTHLLRPEQITNDMGGLIVHQYFRYSLQNSLMFESLVALTQANLSVGAFSEQKLDPGSLYHYGQALQKLQQALQDRQAQSEDALLFSITALMGIDYLLDDMRSFQVHLQGVRQIVALRGGVEQLGWPMILKPSLIGLEAIWTYICSQPQLLKAPIICQPLADTVITAPFNRSMPSEDMDRMLYELPPGIAALAYQHRLSLPVMSLVHKVNTFDSWITHLDFPNPRVTRYGQQHFDRSRLQNGKLIFNASNLQEIEYAVRLLSTPGLTYLERVCCIAMLIICISATRSEKNSAIHMQHVQNVSEEILKAPFSDEDPTATSLYLWVSINLARTMAPSTSAEQDDGFTDLPDSQKYEGDKRLSLSLKVYDWFKIKRNGTVDESIWAEIEENTKSNFIWNDGCVAGQRWAWDLASAWRQKD